MRKLIFLLFLVSSSGLLAQELYNGPLDNTYQPARVLSTDGVIHDVIMNYQSPEYYRNPQNKFGIIAKEKNEFGNEVKLKLDIESFIIDNNIWALRTIKGQKQFVVLTRQGAIERFEYILNGQFGDNVTVGAYMVMGARSKTMSRNSVTNEIVDGEPDAAKVRAWIADSPESVEDLKAADALAAAQSKKNDSLAAVSKPKETKKGLMGSLEKLGAVQAEGKREAAAQVDMSRIIHNYNVLYNQRNVGKVKYYFVEPPVGWKQLPKEYKSYEELKAEGESDFANRSTTVSPEMASAKDNMPVKKETFDAKMQRIKADGNKIGVFFHLKPVKVNKPSSGTTAVDLNQSASVEGSYLDEGLKATAQDFIQELNQTLNTSDIELIDRAKIPYRNVKILGTSTPMDDWWATKYKVVFFYTVDPQLKAGHEEIGGKMKFAASVNMITSLICQEFIGGPGSTKQDIQAQVINMGNFMTPTYSQDDDMKDVKMIYNKVLEKLGTPMLEKIKTERAAGMAKVHKKLLE